MLSTSDAGGCLDDAGASLRARILDSLNGLGLNSGGDSSSLDLGNDKDAIRRLHYTAVQHAVARAKPGLQRHEGSLLLRIASGMEVEPEHICPRLVEIAPDSEDELLFRYAKLHWSIPISAGYGRRLRFLLIDENNDKLIGILGLGDPVYRLEARDKWIGWDAEEKRKRIGSVMDAFVLGAVPPYSLLLGSKLVALAACSAEVANAFGRKYGTRPTWIASQRHEGGLALITTTSALGRSSVYNRLRIRDKSIFESVGFTKGSGEFHFANDLYADILRYVREHSEPTAKHGAWGTGFRNKREVVLKVLALLGLPRSLIYHGVKREVFMAPIATNAREFLRNEDQVLNASACDLSETVAYFKERWLMPRAQWDGRYQKFNPAAFALWNVK